MDIWSLVTGTIWGSYGTFRKQSFPRSTRLWMGFEGLSLISLPAHTLSLSFHQQTLFPLPCHLTTRMPSLCNHKLGPFFFLAHGIWSRQWPSITAGTCTSSYMYQDAQWEEWLLPTLSTDHRKTPHWLPCSLSQILKDEKSVITGANELMFARYHSKRMKID